MSSRNVYCVNLSRLYVCLATICCFLNDGYFARCENHCFIKSLFYNTMSSFLKHYSILLKLPGVKLSQNSSFCRENFCNDFFKIYIWEVQVHGKFVIDF